MGVDNINEFNANEIFSMDNTGSASLSCVVHGHLCPRWPARLRQSILEIIDRTERYACGGYKPHLSGAGIPSVNEGGASWGLLPQPLLGVPPSLKWRVAPCLKAS